MKERRPTTLPYYRNKAIIPTNTLHLPEPFPLLRAVSTKRRTAIKYWYITRRLERGHGDSWATELWISDNPQVSF